MSDNITREPYRNAWYKQLSDAVKKHDEEIAEMLPHLVPDVEEGDNGKILIADEEGAFDWGQPPEELPIITESDEGKVLKVDEGVPKWLEDKDAEIPSHTASDEGKMLSVNAQNALEWKDVPDDVMIVHFEDHTYASATPPVHSCDKTFAEIKAHIESGKTVLAIHKSTFPTGQTTEGTTINLYYAHTLPYTGTNPEVMEFVSNSLGVEQSGVTTDYSQCIGRTIRLNQDDTFTITTMTGYITSPNINAIGKFLKYTGVFQFEYVDVRELPAATSADEGKVVMVDSNGDYVLGTVSGGTPNYTPASLSLTENLEVT